jgi:hypothetical protein
MTSRIVLKGRTSFALFACSLARRHPQIPAEECPGRLVRPADLLDIRRLADFCRDQEV